MGMEERKERHIKYVLLEGCARLRGVPLVFLSLDECAAEQAAASPPGPIPSPSPVVASPTTPEADSNSKTNSKKKKTSKKQEAKKSKTTDATVKAKIRKGKGGGKSNSSCPAVSSAATSPASAFAPPSTPSSPVTTPSSSSPVAATATTNPPLARDPPPPSTRTSRRRAGKPTSSTAGGSASAAHSPPISPGLSPCAPAPAPVPSPPPAVASPALSSPPPPAPASASPAAPPKAPMDDESETDLDDDLDSDSESALESHDGEGGEDREETASTLASSPAARTSSAVQADRGEPKGIESKDSTRNPKASKKQGGRAKIPKRESAGKSASSPRVDKMSKSTNKAKMLRIQSGAHEARRKRKTSPAAEAGEQARQATTKLAKSAAGTNASTVKRELLKQENDDGSRAQNKMRADAPGPEFVAREQGRLLRFPVLAMGDQIAKSLTLNDIAIKFKRSGDACSAKRDKLHLWVAASALFLEAALVKENEFGLDKSHVRGSFQRCLTFIRESIVYFHTLKPPLPVLLSIINRCKAVATSRQSMAGFVAGAQSGALDDVKNMTTQLSGRPSDKNEEDTTEVTLKTKQLKLVMSMLQSVEKLNEANRAWTTASAQLAAGKKTGEIPVINIPLPSSLDQAEPESVLAYVKAMLEHIPMSAHDADTG